MFSRHLLVVGLVRILLYGRGLAFRKELVIILGRRCKITCDLTYEREDSIYYSFHLLVPAKRRVVPLCCDTCLRLRTNKSLDLVESKINRGSHTTSRGDVPFIQDRVVNTLPIVPLQLI